MTEEARATRLARRMELGDETERWNAAAELGELVFEAPEQAWSAVLHLGSSPNEDIRAAIATCVLEHLLEHYFDIFFPRLEAAVDAGNEWLADTLRLSWKLGQAQEPSKAARWDALLGRSKA